MSSESPRSSGGGLTEVVTTLPVAAIATITILLVGGFAASAWFAFAGPEAMHEMASHLMVVHIPLLVAVITAIGVRRSSSREIDRLVTRFLDGTIKDRLEIACRDHAHSGYPFSSVALAAPSRGRSYVYFELAWADGLHAPVRVGVKMNIFNIEVLADLDLVLPEGLDLTHGTQTFIIDHDNMAELLENDVLQRFQGVIQGSVEEGYAVRVRLHQVSGRHAGMKISLRQKLQENILSSLYLKRYFAEDITIAVGVLFDEWRQSGLVPSATQTS